MVPIWIPLVYTDNLEKEASRAIDSVSSKTVTATGSRFHYLRHLLIYLYFEKQKVKII